MDRMITSPSQGEVLRMAAATRTDALSVRVADLVSAAVYCPTCITDAFIHTCVDVLYVNVHHLGRIAVQFGLLL